MDLPSGDQTGSDNAREPSDWNSGSVGQTPVAVPQENSAGFYIVGVTVTDVDGGSATAGPQHGVVYGEAAGYVQGSGPVLRPDRR